MCNRSHFRFIFISFKVMFFSSDVKDFMNFNLHKRKLCFQLLTNIKHLGGKIIIENKFNLVLYYLHNLL